MNKFQKIFYSLGYYEWLTIITLFTLLILTSVYGSFDIFMLISILSCAIIFVISINHNSSFHFDKNKLSKYKIKYRIVDVNVNDQVYFIPVAQFISKYGYLYEFIILNNNWCSIDDYSLDYRLKKLKEDPVKEIKSGNKGYLWHEKREDALYAIKCYREKFEEKQCQRAKINFHSTSVNFKK